MSEQGRSEPRDSHAFPGPTSREPADPILGRRHVTPSDRRHALLRVAAFAGTVLLSAPALLIAPWAVPGCGTDQGPSLAIAQKSIQLGEIAQEKKVKLALTLKNTGTDTLVIGRIRVS